jgi:NAD(P)-dependent dehydrogenase (short-subunit alcohol dehydrogenase family)
VDRLRGEVAVVTGATSGLGREVARVLAAEGARVVVSGRDQGRGEAVAGAIRDAGDAAAFVAADLRTEEGCRGLIAAAAGLFGPPTVLVNNATSPEAIAADSDLAGVRREVWQEMFEVNLLAPAILCREVIPYMKSAGRGSIVNISSRAAERGTPRLAAYSSTKAGLNAIARSVTVDHTRDGIRCNNLQLGYVLNDVRDRAASSSQMTRWVAMSATRLPTAHDVAQAVVFLAGPESETLAGETVHLDGGSSVLRGVVPG